VELRTQYLELVQSCGTSQQKQEALIQATIWLRKHPTNLSVRIHYQKLVDKCDTDTIRYLVNYNLEKYPGDTTLLCTLFYYFKDYLDYHSCRYLGNSILTNFDFKKSSYKNYKTLIYIANFFREYGDFDAAENLYFRVIKNPEAQAIKSSQNRQQLITLAFLNYALLLLLRQPPNPYTAIDYLEPILAENPKHCVAHWYMARCYQFQGYNHSSKGRKIYQQATKHFQKAIEFDQGIKGEKTGRFWYEFGCFYRDAMQNPTEACTCFENSLNQKINLPACVDLAELEVANGNIERARELLQQGLALVPITRPEKEQREKLDSRIQAIQSQLDL
jgi:Tfp pilus assembly protein PilF